MNLSRQNNMYASALDTIRKNCINNWKSRIWPTSLFLRPSSHSTFWHTILKYKDIIIIWYFFSYRFLLAKKSSQKTQCTLCFVILRANLGWPLKPVAKNCQIFTIQSPPLNWVVVVDNRIFFHHVTYYKTSKCSIKFSLSVWNAKFPQLQLDNRISRLL